MHPAPMEAVDAIVHQHFAFLTARGFVLDPEPPRKQAQRDGFRYIVYRGERWAIEIYLEYREGYYPVSLVPLEQGQPRKVPSGYRTKWSLEDYLSRVLRIRDTDIRRVNELYEAASPLSDRVTVEFADQLFEVYATLLDRHLDAIVASPHPPVGRK